MHILLPCVTLATTLNIGGRWTVGRRRVIWSANGAALAWWVAAELDNAELDNAELDELDNVMVNKLNWTTLSWTKAELDNV